jgi:hypothetical protein
MKILIYAVDEASRQEIMDVAGGHHLFKFCSEATNIPHDLARTTPHLFISFGEVPEAIRQLFPDTRFCGLDKTGSWRDSLRSAMAQPLAVEQPRPFADDTRMICHDPSLISYWKGKLGQPQATEGWKEEATLQEARFLMQLEAGRKHHKAAKHYHSCLLAQLPGLEQEVSYRLVHRSYKGLLWSRDFASRWLALLAHYCAPEVELEYLPRAGSPGPRIDYVHASMPPEGQYACIVLLLSGINPVIAAIIKEVVLAEFTGQDDVALLAQSLSVCGFVNLLRQVAEAQISLMDWWLSKDFAPDYDMERTRHRNVGIHRDFWRLNWVGSSPDVLNKLVAGFHAGTSFARRARKMVTFLELQKRPSEQETQNRDCEAGADTVRAGADVVSE